ncbi:MAG: hypothetical protein U0836_03075 [Pirellulales bacterium]
MVLAVGVVAWGRYVSLNSSPEARARWVQASLEGLGCTVWRDPGRRDWTREWWRETLGRSVKIMVTAPEGFGDAELAEAAVLLSEEPAVALWLGQSEVTSDGLHALAEIKHLQAITLPARQTTPDDFATLAKAPELFLVALAGDGLSDEALKPLSQLPALTHLLVVAPLLGDEALEHVRQLEQLTHFIYFKTPFSQQALDALRKARPSLQVIEHKPRYGC